MHISRTNKNFLFPDKLNIRGSVCGGVDVAGDEYQTELSETDLIDTHMVGLRYENFPSFTIKQIS